MIVETATDLPQETVEGLRLMANEAYRKEDYPEAIRLYTAALACLERIDPKDRGGRGPFLARLGLSHQYVKDFAAARRLHEAELRLARQLRKPEFVADALHRLGDTYIELKDSRRAAPCLSESLKLCRKLNPHSRDIPHLLYDLARIAEDRKQWSLAIRHYREWIAVQRSRHDDELPRGWYRLGWVAEEQRQWQTAEDHYYSTLIAAQEMGSAVWEGYAYLGLGRIAVEWERYDRADNFYREALRLAEPTKRRHLISSVFLSRGNCAYRRGNFADACSHYSHSIRTDYESQKWADVVLGFQNFGAAQYRQDKPGFSAFAFAMADAVRENYGESHTSRFADYYRAKCKKAVSEETWRQAQERTKSVSIPDALDYLSEE